MELAGDAYALDIVGDRAYVADGDAGLAVLDVTDPQQPREVGRLATPSVALGVEVTEDLAYVTGARDALWIVDVADPRALALAGRFGDVEESPSRRRRGIRVEGDVAYVLGYDRLHLVDASDANQPVSFALPNDPAPAIWGSIWTSTSRRGWPTC